MRPVSVTDLGEAVRVLEVFLVVTAAIIAGGVCRRFAIAAPLPLLAVGVAIGVLPFTDGLDLNPDLLLELVLPPLLFSAALASSYIGIRANLRPVLMLSVGLVVFTALVVGVTVGGVLPDLPLAAAIALGAVLGPADAVASAAIARKVGMPRRTLTIIEGENLINDGTALTVFNVAVAAAVAGSVTGWEVGQIVLASVVGGFAIGFAAGWAIRELFRRTRRDSLLDNALILVTPFLVFAMAEDVEASGFLAVVIAGLVLAHSTTRTGYATRLQLAAVWSVMTFVFESLAFLVVGLELPHVVADLSDNGDLDRVVVPTVVALLAVVLARIVWVFPATYIPRLLSRRIRTEDPAPPVRTIAVVAWAGMRGPVSLFAALALPLTVDDGAPFPDRDLLILVTTLVVIGTLLLQGLTLGPLITHLGVADRDVSARLLAEAEAQHHAAQAALARLDEELEVGPRPPDDIVQKLRSVAERRSLSAWEQLGGPEETPSDAYRRLRLAMLDAERDVFVQYRDEGRLPEDVLRRVFRDLDLEQAVLDRG
ncbi:MAG: Na+/H+ antiporter [Candidatus Nanopelagicales bacterium]